MLQLYPFNSNIQLSDACEILTDKTCSTLVLLCVNGSDRIPVACGPFGKNDQRLKGTSHLCDIGAAHFCKELSHRFRCSICIANFSKLVCNVNRAKTNKNCILETLDGRIVEFNHNISQVEKDMRFKTYYDKFFIFAKQLIGNSAPNSVVVSIRTMPWVVGQPLQLDVNIMFKNKRGEEIAAIFQQEFFKKGVKASYNTPYSGQRDVFGDGEMLHAVGNICTQQREYITLMFRNDLIMIPFFRTVVIEAMIEACVVLNRIKKDSMYRTNKLVHEV